MALIKFALSRNLIYPLQVIIWKFLRESEILLLSKLYNFENSLIFTPLMFLGEFFSGLIIYKYQKGFFLKKQQNKKDKSLIEIELIQNQPYLNLVPIDSYYKIYFLIFVSAFLDFVQFRIRTSFLNKFKSLSISFPSRLGAMTTIFGAFYYIYGLKLPLFKHQFFSLIVIAVCIVIIIVLEFIFQEINIFLSYGDLFLVLFILIIDQFLEPIIDTIEKYLFEYNFVNPFKELMFEGLFGFLLTLIYFFLPEYLKDVGEVYNNYSSGEFILFIFLLFIYVVLCGGRNIFKVITTKLYSPMARVFTDYFINPIYLIYYFTVDNDFATDSYVKSAFYFSINLILSIIISFCGCVFNEFIILFFCGLEHETHDQITKRSKYIEEDLMFEMNDNNSSNA